MNILAISFFFNANNTRENRLPTEKRISSAENAPLEGKNKLAHEWGIAMPENPL